MDNTSESKKTLVTKHTMDVGHLRICPKMSRSKDTLLIYECLWHKYLILYYFVDKKDKNNNMNNKFIYYRVNNVYEK